MIVLAEEYGGDHQTARRNAVLKYHPGMESSPMKTLLAETNDFPHLREKYGFEVRSMRDLADVDRGARWARIVVLECQRSSPMISLEISDPGSMGPTI
jgi:hypothetical protein